MPTLTKIIKKTLLTGALVLGCNNLSGCAFHLKQGAESFINSYLGNVNLSRKKVTLDIYIDNDRELAGYHQNKDKIFQYISDFYKGMNVDLDINFVDSIDQSVLKPAKHLAFEILPGEKCLQRRCEFLGITTEFGCEHLEKESPTAGVVDLEKSIGLICHSAAESSFHEKCEKLKPGLSNRIKANLIVHELGHLFGLYHSNLFTDDPIPDYLSGDVPNFMRLGRKMKFSPKFTLGAGFNEFQKGLVHSYLSGGKVYQELEAAGFNYTEYIKNIKRANGYIVQKKDE